MKSSVAHKIPEGLNLISPGASWGSKYLGDQKGMIFKFNPFRIGQD
jgi:hypothetical protein